MPAPSPSVTPSTLVSCVLAAACGALLAAPASASADDGRPSTDKITEYATTAEIHPDGTVAISETITYDFGDVPSPGLYREIPLTIASDSTWLRERRITLDDLEVTSPTGADTRLDQASEQGGDFLILVGAEDDPSTDVTGEQTYVLSYTVEGALTPLEDHDEFRWNFVGTEWDVPILGVSADVTAPEITALDCFAGDEGGTDPCDAAEYDGTTATVAHEWLIGGQALTTAVELPHGAVAVAEPEYRLRLLYPLALAGMALSLLVIAAVVIAEFIGRARARSFGGEPPGDMTPGLASLMLTPGVDVAPDVLLTMVVELEQRGVVTARPDPDMPGEWRFAMARPGGHAEVSDAEGALLDALFRSGPHTTLRSFAAAVTPQDARTVRKALLAEGRRLGLVTTRRSVWGAVILIGSFLAPVAVLMLGDQAEGGAGVAAVSLFIAGMAGVWKVGIKPLTRYGHHVRTLLLRIGYDTNTAGPRSVAPDPAWAVAVGAAENLPDHHWPGLTGDGPQGYGPLSPPYYVDPVFRSRWTSTLRSSIAPKSSGGGGGGGGGGAGGGGGGGGGGAR